MQHAYDLHGVKVMAAERPSQLSPDRFSTPESGHSSAPSQRLGLVGSAMAASGSVPAESRRSPVRSPGDGFSQSFWPQAIETRSSG